MDREKTIGAGKIFDKSKDAEIDGVENRDGIGVDDVSGRLGKHDDNELDSVDDSTRAFSIIKI